MKPKESKTYAPFPTIGELFHYCIQSADFPDLKNAFSKTVEYDKTVKKDMSDKLREWACEEYGPPSRKDMQEHLQELTKNTPLEEGMSEVLGQLWTSILDGYSQTILSTATHTDKKMTRSWLAKNVAPTCLSIVHLIQKIFRHEVLSGPHYHSDPKTSTTSASSKEIQAGPLLEMDFHIVIYHLFSTEGKKKHPLTKICIDHYLEDINQSGIDEKTIREWKKEHNLPRLDSLGIVFDKKSDGEKKEAILNFIFARMLETLAHSFKKYCEKDKMKRLLHLLFARAKCEKGIDTVDRDYRNKNPEASSMEHLEQIKKAAEVCEKKGHEFASDPDTLKKFPEFKTYPLYGSEASASPIPEGFLEFISILNDLCVNTSLAKSNILDPEKHGKFENTLKDLRKKFPKIAKCLPGHILLIEARLLLGKSSAKANTIANAVDKYAYAVRASIYSGGEFTKGILIEATGLTAMLHRHELKGQGAKGTQLKSLLKHYFGWVDLLNISEFPKEKDLEQRIERSEQLFRDHCSSSLIKQLAVGLKNTNFERFGFDTSAALFHLNYVKSKANETINPRRKGTMKDTIFQRDQTPIMEILDRACHADKNTRQEHIKHAKKRNRDGDDLNFIDSSGETALVKAFAAGAFDLVILMLRREKNPVTLQTIHSAGKKKGRTLLHYALDRGRLDILRALSQPLNDRPSVDFNRKIEIAEMQHRTEPITPLYYAVSCLSSAKELKPLAPKEFGIGSDKDLISVIRFLVNEIEVDLDTPNTNGHSALTVAAESGMHEIMALLLQNGADPDHCVQGGGTALLFAVTNDDCRMADLLLKYNANYRLYVEADGRPIHTFPMSENMRKRIPKYP